MSRPVKLGDPVDVLVAVPRGAAWQRGRVVNISAVSSVEGHARYDVRCLPGELYRGCHPKSIRRVRA